LGHRPHSTDSLSGILYGLAAYGLWGLMPLYFAAIRHVPSYEILAQRIVWCGLFLAMLLTAAGRWGDLARALRSRAVRLTFLATALLLSANWLTYIHGVTTGRAVETSLGYFINPLLSVALGVVVFRERLSPWQVSALGLATAGVLVLVITAGQVPWIALTVAFSFALYGLLRKTAPADAVVGLAIETFYLVMPSAAFLALFGYRGGLVFGTSGLTTDLLLLASGVITAVPLLCFGQAARNLRLSTLGFLQYLAPTVQFLLAITVLGESMNRTRWWSFTCIWVALAVFSFDTWRGLATGRSDRALGRAAPQPLPAVSRTD
jgi:chloramphenicol-sensitive protein RarD